MEKTYSPELFEKEIYQVWKNNKYFSARVDYTKRRFSMVMPPPNVTGQLHLGHAVNNTMQDIIIRVKRMQGFETLWVPGTDHAAIATEAKIVEKVLNEGKTKEEIGRENFIKLGWEWYKTYGNTIVNQLEKLGVSPDWDRLAFTMDENLSKAVVHAFVHYYEKGYIYRGKRVTNWCPHCKSAISDLENEYELRQTYIWHIKYTLEDGSGCLTVATTRPETMFGDTAVAVNPNDKRYNHLIGKNVILPIVNRPIPIIADEYCDMAFGSGAVKITPAHDPNDYEIGLRHNLEIISCIDDGGKLNEIAGEFAGLDRDVARQKVAEKLESLNLLEKKEKYKHNVGTCQRCKTVTEPRITTQWWVKMEELAKPAIQAVKEGKLKFIPKRYEKQYLNWLENIKDWCISRQLWLGHRIPAYYDENGEVYVAKSMEEAVKMAGGKKLTQDEDVLDTWFSSALWPFSTLGYPEMTEDLKYFYPTNTLVTAYDIITFWVSKMVYSGLEFMKEIPFTDCVIHGLVRDKLGRKMSKSLGNGIDPLQIIEKYGADSLRYSLIFGMGVGVDTKYDEEKAKQAKIFINKLYQASKFVLLHTESLDKDINLKQTIIDNKNNLTYQDKWILTELNKLTKEVTKNIEKYELGIALGKLTNFIWNKFCDWYIELSKVSLFGTNQKEQYLTKVVLGYVLENILKLIHPFIPFVTEYIYLNFPWHAKTIMLEKYPEYEKVFVFAKDSKDFEEIIEIIKKVRVARADLKVPDNKRSKLYLQVSGKQKLYNSCLNQIEKLAFGLSIETNFNPDQFGKNIKVSNENANIYILLEDLVDNQEKQKREQGELKKIEFEIERSEKLLANPGFINKAPKELINKEKEKLEKFKFLKEKLLKGD